MSEFSDKVASLVRCPVCLEDFSKDCPPITLLCGHNLCRDCLSRLKKRQAFLKCPIDNINKKVDAQEVNADFLQLVEGLGTTLDQPRKRQLNSEAAVQCEYADIMKPWGKEYRRTSRRVQHLEHRLSTLYKGFQDLVLAHMRFFNYPVRKQLSGYAC